MPAIPPHSTDTSDKPWDGPANEARLRNEESADYYRSAHAWVDPDGDEQTKAAYKFIHHEVAEGGDVGAANIAGCQAVIGILNGARTGGDPSRFAWWKDRQGIYNHVAKHLRDADVEPAELKDMASEAPAPAASAEATTDLQVVRAAAAAAERARLAKIDELTEPGLEHLAATAKADPSVTPEGFALQVLEARRDRRKTKLEALRDDEAHLDKPAPVVGTGLPNDTSEEVHRTLAVYYAAQGKPMPGSARTQPHSQP